jgi:putative transposase
VVSPSGRRNMAKHFEQDFEMSERRASSLAQLSRSVLRYRSKRGHDGDVREQLNRLATARPRFGYRRLTVLLHREGLTINHKRVFRIYQEEGLAVRRKRRKRRAQAPRERLAAATEPNQRWSMDFISDTLENGRSIRVLTIVDACSRLSPAIEIDTSIAGERVARVLDRAGDRHGFPKTIVVDNGPEFTSKALDAWAHRRGIELHFIRPGKPVEVGFDPSGDFLVVTEKATNKIDVFPVAPNGTLGAIMANASHGTTPFGFEFSDADTLIVSEAFGGAVDASAVSSYHLAPTGALTVVTGSAPTHQTAACWIATTPPGRLRLHDQHRQRVGQRLRRRQHGCADRVDRERTDWRPPARWCADRCSVGQEGFGAVRARLRSRRGHRVRARCQ